MTPIFDFFIKMFVSIPVFLVIWLVTYFQFQPSFPIATGFSVIGGLLIYTITSAYLTHRNIKRNGLSRKEYRYIRQNLEEARKKVFRLNKALISIRHIPSFKDRIELIKVSRKIYSLTKKEPKRFFVAEQFYYSHLDSALEIAEKYVFLSRQPKKTREMDQHLRDALWTLEGVKESIENDLYRAISEDVEKLDYEIDVAKHSLKKHER